MTSVAGNSAPNVPAELQADNDALWGSPADALDLVAREWDKAEGLIKLAERLRAAVVQPSINELRYAGRRLVDAWKLAENAAKDLTARENFDAYVKDALFRCHCAQHDAIDASVLFVQSALREYEAEFGPALLIQHFPAVADLRASLTHADELIVTSRTDRGRRAVEYDRLAVEHLPTIVRIYQTIVSNRQTLEELVAEKLQKEKRETSRFRWGLGWTIAATVGAAILGAIITLAFAPKPSPQPSTATQPATSTAQQVS